MTTISARSGAPDAQTDEAVTPRDGLPGAGQTSARATASVLRSCDLLAGRRTVVIRHGTEDYRLQVTRNGRLILTK